MTDYVEVLLARYPGSEWVLNGRTYDGLVWVSDTPKPSQQELDDLWPAVRDENDWREIRVKRDGLLAASDWTMIADAPLNADQVDAWEEYRQILRDIPQTFDKPADVVWPVAP